jgi:hypothetical protein
MTIVGRKRHTTETRRTQRKGKGTAEDAEDAERESDD